MCQGHWGNPLCVQQYSVRNKLPTSDVVMVIHKSTLDVRRKMLFETDLQMMQKIKQ